VNRSAPDDILFRSLALTAIILCGCALALYADNTEELADSGQSLWGLLKGGGWAMWPLGGCCLALFFLIFFSLSQTRQERFIPAGLLVDLKRRLVARDLDSVQRRLATSDTVLARCLRASLSKARIDTPDANKDQVESDFVEAAEAEESGIAQWINYLNVIATVSPMIGLLGTVSGMIGAFQTIARGGMGRPELLAGDIGQALITTATGLVIGIPAMIAYFVLRNRLAGIMQRTSREAGCLIDALVGNQKPEDGTGGA